MLTKDARGDDVAVWFLPGHELVHDERFPTSDSQPEWAEAGRKAAINGAQGRSLSGAGE